MGNESKLLTLAARFRRGSRLFQSLGLQPRATFIAVAGRERWGIWRLGPRTPETESAWVSFSLLASLAIEELGIPPMPAPEAEQFDPNWPEQCNRMRSDPTETVPAGLDEVDPCARAWLHFLWRECLDSNSSAFERKQDGGFFGEVWEASAIQCERSAQERIQARLTGENVKADVTQPRSEGEDQSLQGSFRTAADVARATQEIFARELAGMDLQQVQDAFQLRLGDIDQALKGVDPKQLVPAIQLIPDFQELEQFRDIDLAPAVTFAAEAARSFVEQLRDSSNDQLQAAAAPGTPAAPGDPVREAAARALRPHPKLIKKHANDRFAIAREHIVKEYAEKLKHDLEQVRLTGNSGGYAPALITWGAERVRRLVLALADASVDEFILRGVTSDATAEADLEMGARQIAADTISEVQGELDLLNRRTGRHGNHALGSLNRTVRAEMKEAVREGVAGMRHLNKSQALPQARAATPTRPPKTARKYPPTTNRPFNVGELMRVLGRPLTPVWTKLIESGFSMDGDWEAKLYKATMIKMQRLAGRMEMSSEDFRSALPVLLHELGLEIPAGVLQPAPGKPGRPASTTTEDIHIEWVERGKPPITAKVCDSIASRFFRDELEGVAPGSPEHRKIRERVRQAIQRHERRVAT